MSRPRVGLNYNDVQNKLTKYKSVGTNPNMKESLINQARLAEGEGAATELHKEFSYKGAHKGVRRMNLMSAKSRGNYKLGMCLPTCKCKLCRQKGSGKPKNPEGSEKPLNSEEK